MALMLPQNLLKINHSQFLKNKNLYFTCPWLSVYSTITVFFFNQHFFVYFTFCTVIEMIESITKTYIALACPGNR